jgi:DNA-binding protein HU-beta
MNKLGLIAAVEKTTKLPKVEIEKVLDAAVEVIQERVSAGDDVTLMGFGTFLLTERKARKGHDPYRDKTIEIPAMKIPKFRVGKEFKTRVNPRKKA